MKQLLHLAVECLMAAKERSVELADLDGSRSAEADCYGGNSDSLIFWPKLTFKDKHGGRSVLTGKCCFKRPSPDAMQNQPDYWLVPQ